MTIPPSDVSRRSAREIQDRRGAASRSPEPEGGSVCGARSRRGPSAVAGVVDDMPGRSGADSISSSLSTVDVAVCSMTRQC